MLRRLLLVLSLCAATFQGPVADAARRCCTQPGSHSPSFAAGCCAGMGCCLIAAQTITPPVTSAPVAHDVTAVPAPAFLVSLSDPPTLSRAKHLAKALPVAHSPPSLALLCTRLI